MHDRIEQLVFESDFSVSVLGRGAIYILIDNSVGHDAALTAYAVANRLTWSGVFGLKDGVTRVECDPHPDSAITMTHAALGFCSGIADQLRNPSRAIASSGFAVCTLCQICGGASMLRTISHAKEIKRAFSGKPCADIDVVAFTSLEWWWASRVVPVGDDRLVFLASLYALPDNREATSRREMRTNYA